MQERSQEGSQAEPIDNLFALLFEKAEGRNNFLEDDEKADPKDLLVQVINDARVQVLWIRETSTTSC